MAYCFIKNISSKRDLKQIALNHLSEIEFKELMKL